MLLQRATSTVRAIAAATARRLTTEAAATEEKIVAKVSEGEKLRKSLINLVHPKRSAVVTLQKWREEGNKIQKYQMNRIVRELRGLKRFKHALEVCEWMNLQPDIKLVAGDYAVHLDLVAKVRGLPSAEKFFEDLPENMRGSLACTSLLHTYVQNKVPEKAEALMDKMTECGFLKNPLPFNHLLSMYIANKQLEKIPEVIQKLRTYTTPDIFTYNLRLTACAGEDDVETAEKVFKELKKVTLEPDWVTYSILANLYVKRKLHEQALPMLKEMEKLASRNNRATYPSLISLYTAIGDSDAVHRIWGQLKSCFAKVNRKNNDAEYICIMTSLVKLNELSEAEKVFGEWESISTSVHPGIPNVLLAAYINNNQLEEARKLHERMEKKRVPPCYTTWELLTSMHLKTGQTKEALDCFQKAVVCVNKWNPDTEWIQQVFSVLEQQGDIEGAEKFLVILRDAGHSSTEVYNSLLRTYAHAGKMPLIVMERMKKDNVELDEETHELLEKTRNMPVSEAASFII
ncbi:Pentatricopeptide repeat-containing protein At4g02820, mitochondrial [Linum grandiflorum]